MGVGITGRTLEISARNGFTRRFTSPAPNEPSEFDQEAYDHWARLFREADLDPKVHVLSSGKADNFWMMGDTGPCGPCSEVHIDLTPDGDTRGALVNKNDPRCIEIWNLVFIQFNANPDGTFTPLPQRHVDTGMGFERAVAIIQGTKNLTDFSGTTSNYETDVFRPIFDELEKLSGKKYASTLPTVQGSAPEPGCGDRRLADRESRREPRRPARQRRALPRTNPNRRRFPRHRRSHSRAFVRNRRRNHPIKRRSRLCFASHLASCSPLRTHAWFSRAVLF